MKVRIDAGGRTVEIECVDANVTADGIGATALGLWQATEGARKPSEGPAVGFQAQVSAQPPAVVGFRHKPMTVNSEVTE